MGIGIYPDSKVYVIAPAKTATGGPELLHQLAYHLRKDLNINAFIYYVPDDFSDPVHPEYKHYNVPFVRKIEDKRKNILVVPEVFKSIQFTKNFKNIRKVLWWLSVDNFYISYLIYKNKVFYIEHLINIYFKKFFKTPLFNAEAIYYKLIKFENLDVINNIKNFDLHLTQSFYAFNHLVKKGIEKEKIYFLSDYLNKEFLKDFSNKNKKENIVAYNPNKGHFFTKKIIKLSRKDIKYVPIQNLNRNEVKDLLLKAKVYIDFGNHPGKDRLPREAAMLGCCVITGKRGSAKFFEDVPIPDEYKFEDKRENIPKIVNKIKDCLYNFEKKQKDFDYYRKIIKEEPIKFHMDLKTIFNKNKGYSV